MGTVRGITRVIVLAATGALGACTSHVAQDVPLSTCNIDGQSVLARGRNPANLSECCLPSLNPVGWSYWFQDGGQLALGDGGEGWWWVGDFNGDGRKDIVFGAYSGVDDAGLGGVLVQVNQGNGSFAPPVLFPFAAPAHEQFIGIAADLNGDGFDDLILVELACCTPAAEAQIVMNQRNGTFGPPLALQDSTTLWSLATGDANGDGILDLFSAGYGDAGVRLQIGSGNGTFEPPVALDTGFGDAGVSIDVASMRGNGVLDLVAFFQDGTLTGASGVSVALGDGKGHFSEPTVYGDNGPGWDGFQVTDFDGDGFPDVVVYDTFPQIWSHGHTRMGLLHGNGDGTLGGIQEVDLDPASVDQWAESVQLSPGTRDLIGISGYERDGGYVSQVNVYWRLGDGGLSPPFPVGPPSASFANFLISDLNGDGAKDILSVSGFFNPTVGQIYLNACGAPAK